tara:strand:+ start:402 stop:911 length:510 start_codon:yes stop_codon:yes gene_type:complete
MIYLNIGSNIKSNFGDRFDNILMCLKILKKYGVLVINSSHFYETPSYPNKSYPKFINIGIKVKFNNSYFDLLKIIALVEKKLGRKKNKKNSPRICDIDIIDFNQICLNSVVLKLPHPRMHLRNFVLYPLFENNSNWTHPKTNQKILNLLNNLSLTSRIEITRLNKSVMI